MSVNIIDKKVASFSVYTAVAVTIVVSPWSNFDPINLAKVLILCIGAFAIFGISISNQQVFFEEFKARKLALTLTFPIFLFATFFLSGANKSQQFWGIFGRNNGLLSYLALYLLFVSVAINSGRFLERPLILSLKVSNLFVLGYALVQLSGNDPIGWSQKGMFATLGNVNFASAFLAISSISWIGTLFHEKQSSIVRMSQVLLIALEFFILMKMDSIQGPVIFAIAFVLLAFLRIRKTMQSKIFFVSSILLAILVVALGLLGVVGKGPFTRFVFQNSNVFRADYMGAALRMIREKPYFGVGLDAYDYWYRNFRGFISAYRTGINRSSNSAHNIFLDIGAGGGLPLLISYLVIVLIAFSSFLRTLRNYRNSSSVALTVAIAWFAYQIQSLISINQIGVGVWGWLLTGAVIAFAHRDRFVNNLDNDSKKSRKSETKRSTNASLPPRALLVAVATGMVGLFCALPPVTADAKFRKAINTSDLGTLLKSDETLGLSSFHMEKSLEAVVGRGMNSESLVLAERIVKKFPRSLFAWQVIAANSQDANTKKSALEKISKLDPWLACLRPEPTNIIKNWFDSMPDPKQIELLRWWGLLPQTSSLSDSQLLVSVPANTLTEKLKSFCGR